MNSRAAKEVDRRWNYWKPFITGLATLSEETVREAHPLELMVIDEVNRRREEYLENRVIRAEMVVRK